MIFYRKHNKKLRLPMRVSKRPFDRLTVLSKVEGLKRDIHSKQIKLSGYLERTSWIGCGSFFHGNLDFPDKRPKLNCGAQRHHYSMFDVGRSMFDVHLFSVRRSVCSIRRTSACSPVASSLFSLLEIRGIIRGLGLKSLLQQQTVHPAGKLFGQIVL